MLPDPSIDVQWTLKKAKTRISKKDFDENSFFYMILMSILNQKKTKEIKMNLIGNGELELAIPRIRVFVGTGFAQGSGDEYEVASDSKFTFQF
jgi:hypothetical protein